MLPFAVPLIEVGKAIIEKIWPDKSKVQEAQIEFEKMVYNGELNQIQEQLEINKIEASNPSVFVSGGRPAAIWVCVCAFAYNSILWPFIDWGSKIWHIPPPPPLDTSMIMPFLTALLGLGAYRTAEKIKGVHRK